MAESEEKWDQQLVDERKQRQQALAESDARWDKRMAESEEKWDQQLADDKKHWNKRWGDLARKMGTIAEDIVAPNIPRIAQVHFGCTDIEDFMVRRQVRHKQNRTLRREFDVIAVYENQIIINETKATPKIEYINDFIKALEDIEGYFPEHQGKTIIPIFASLYLGEDIVNYLTKKKIYAMAMGDETMELLNVQDVSTQCH